MANQREGIDDLLKLRRLTRAVSDSARERMQTYLATLSPLLRPKRTFGDHIQGTSTEIARHADAAVKDLTALHDRLVGAKPFSLRTPLTLPIRMPSATLEVTPLEYGHTTGGGDSRRVSVRSPLKWILSYSGYGPARLKELLASRQRSPEDLHDHLVNFLILHVVFAQQSGATDLLRALHFPVVTERLEEFGDLPLTCVTCDISTIRPSDAVINESAELSGMDAFEEVVRVDDVAALRDPLREELVALLDRHGLGQ
jgi:hypothetical protein